MEYETKSHCKYLIALHLILVVKYRKQLLKGDVGVHILSSFDHPIALTLIAYSH